MNFIDEFTNASLHDIKLTRILIVLRKVLRKHIENRRHSGKLFVNQKRIGEKIKGIFTLSLV